MVNVEVEVTVGVTVGVTVLANPSNVVGDASNVRHRCGYARLVVRL